MLTVSSWVASTMVTLSGALTMAVGPPP